MLSRLEINDFSYNTIKFIVRINSQEAWHKFNINEIFSIDIESLPSVIVKIVNEYLTISIPCMFETTKYSGWIFNIGDMFTIRYGLINTFGHNTVIFTYDFNNKLLESLLNKYFAKNHLYYSQFCTYWHSYNIVQYKHRVTTDQTNMLRFIIFLYNMLLSIYND